MFAPDSTALFHERVLEIVAHAVLTSAFHDLPMNRASPSFSAAMSGETGNRGRGEDNLWLTMYPVSWVERINVRSFRRRERDLRGERGQTTLELALVAPILVVLLFAIAQFGIVFYHWIQLTRAVSAGGRAAAVCRFTPVADMPTFVHNAAPSLNAGSMPVSWSGCPVSGASTSVTASYPFGITIPFLGTIKTGTLSHTATEQTE